MAQKLAVVTGGAGFIGSHLCERLVKEGYRVISLDNYFTGSKDNHVAGVEYREGHTKDIAKLIPEDPDIIYHLGEYARVEQSVLEPEIVHDLNTVGTKAVIKYWTEKKPKLVYAGSSTKFGDDGAARNTSPYARTKAENTELIRVAGETEKLPFAITYFYNVYGPRERSGVYGTVVEQFKKMYELGAPCAVVRPGTQLRNFTHVEDIVSGLMLVGKSGHGDEYGLGNQQAYSIFDLAKLFGFGDDIILFPERPGNRMNSSLDTNKISALGWNTCHSLPDYIREFTNSTIRGAKKDRKILVFSTTMHPTAGVAEEAFVELAGKLKEVQFDVITTHFVKNGNAAPLSHPNIQLYRVGVGSVFDKYLLIILGVIKALSLKQSYLFTWSLMASYGAFASFILKKIRYMPVLITLADQDFSSVSFVKRILLSLLVGRADQVYGTHCVQEGEVSSAINRALPRNSLGEGDAFANALRYAYADIVRRLEKC